MLWLVVMAMLALLLPADAAAHGRGPTVAIDDRLEITHHGPGLSVRILDGDRSLQLTVDRDHTVVVRGYLDEPMLRFANGMVTANRASATAGADKIVSAGSGWVEVARGRTYAWHDHRLAPPVSSTGGPTAHWSVPLTVDGQPSAITGTFLPVGRPSLLPWSAGALLAAAAILWEVHRRPRRRATAVLVLAVSAAAAALVAIGAFAFRDAPTGGIQWLQLVGGAVVAVVAAVVLLRTHGPKRTAAAGVIGGLAAVGMLSSLPIFRHGVVISALPADAARLFCAVALVGGLCSAALSFAGDVPVRRAAR